MSQYIGKTISLVSNSDIRYVGILHEINSEQSTVSLKQVRSFGTEGRRNGIEEIPASEGVYEFIVFRGSDVKDLKIADANQQYGQYYGYQHPPSQGQQPVQQPQQLSQQQAAIAVSPPIQKPPQESPRQVQPITPAVPVVSAPAPVQSIPVQPAQPSVQRAPLSGLSNAAPPSGPSNSVSSGPSNIVPPPSGPAQKSVRPHKPHHHPNGRHVPEDPETPDFDFVSSNAKFTKDEELIPEAPTEFYNKKSSFFDNISSTAKEKAEGRENLSPYERRGDERKLNLETFGQAAAYSGRGRGRGRGGRGGRGGYRGRGGNNFRGRGGRGGFQVEAEN